MSRALVALAVAAVVACLSGCATPCCYCYCGESGFEAVAPTADGVRAEVPVAGRAVNTTTTTARY